jgi:hypothetical protein
LKWPSKTSLSDSDNIKLAILAKIAEVWPPKEFLSKIWPLNFFDQDFGPLMIKVGHP